MFDNIKPSCKHLNFNNNHCDLLGAKCIKERFFKDDYCKLEDNSWKKMPMPEVKVPKTEEME